jgi:hypothetical protein
MEFESYTLLKWVLTKIYYKNTSKSPYRFSKSQSMKYYPRLFTLLILFAFSSCNSKRPDFKNFDFDQWKSDRKGCKNLRITQKNALNALRQDIKGVSQNDIAETFGRPDAQILDERNKKIYIYYLETGEQCLSEKIVKPSNAETVALYFNAVGLVIEMTFQKGNP